MPTNFPTQQQSNSALHHIHTFVTSLPKIGLILLATILAVIAAKGLAVLILRVLDPRRLLERQMIFLELTPPAFSDRSLHANQQFCSDLHGFETIRSVADEVLPYKRI